MNENETLSEIEADLRSDKRRFSNSDATAIASRIEYARKRQEESHKREVEALKQRIKELDAEVAAKDEVIKRLNDAIAEEQKRHLATTENSSAVGNTAKMREAVALALTLLDLKEGVPYKTVSQKDIDFIKAALAAPPRRRATATSTQHSMMQSRALQIRGGGMMQSGIANGIAYSQAGSMPPTRKEKTMEANNKLRKALETLVDVVDAWKDHLPPVIREGELAKAIKKAESALAEPAKNCEAGTVAQQAKRFEEYCESEVCKRNRCKSRAKALCIERCALAWAQMPYSPTTPSN